MAKKDKDRVKTNVMRLLDKAGISYESREYAYSEDDLSGVHAAAELGYPCEMVFKTLVLHGDKSGYFVCCIPVDQEIDLKKAAQVSGNKKAEMLHVKELLPLTGYLRGGCSPVGMNAHPHVSCDSRIAVVHNGIIENFAELREELEGRGHTFAWPTARSSTRVAG